MSDHLDTRTAATEVAHTLRDRLADSPADLLFLFGSYHHRAGIAGAAKVIGESLSARAVLGVTAESVIADDEEREGRAGLSALALALPHVHLHTFHVETIDPDSAHVDSPAMRERIGWREDSRAAILFLDPFGIPPETIDRIALCPGNGRMLPISGGFATGSSQPGQNVLIHNDQAASTGLVGVTISGEIDIDFIVSQGCRPIGPPLVVTKSTRNMVFEVAGKNVLQVVQEIANDLDDRERGLLTKGLLLGVVIDEYNSRFGRADFLIRNVMGIEQKRKSLLINDVVRTGQTIQFHVRDATTADEDLRLLLDAQELKGPALGALLFTCNGRGKRLFDQPNHDAGVLRERLVGGAGDAGVPLAGFFAAGEIGPVGGRSFIHGHTASAVVFRARHANDL